METKSAKIYHFGDMNSFSLYCLNLFEFVIALTINLFFADTKLTKLIEEEEQSPIINENKLGFGKNTYKILFSQYEVWL